MGCLNRFSRCKTGFSIFLASLFLQACTVMPQTAEFKASMARHSALGGEVIVRNIDGQLIESQRLNNVKGDISCGDGVCPDDWDYRIGAGDVLSIVVWEHPQLTIPAGPNRTPTEAGNRVHGDGTIFYPYIGNVSVKDKTIAEVRTVIANGLKKIIPNPQVDVTVAHFRESNQIYVMGEIERPGPLVLGMARLSLTDAIARSGGVDNANANAKGVFVFRRDGANSTTEVFKLDVRSPSAFLTGTQFNLEPQDVVYVTAAPAARWGRIISKLVPSLSALNTLLILQDRL